MKKTYTIKRKNEIIKIRFSSNWLRRLNKTIGVGLVVHERIRKRNGFSKKKDDELIDWFRGSMDIETGSFLWDCPGEKYWRKLIRDTWIKNRKDFIKTTGSPNLNKENKK